MSVGVQPLQVGTMRKLEKLDVRGNQIADLQNTKTNLLKLAKLTSVAFQDIDRTNANPICKDAVCATFSAGLGGGLSFHAAKNEEAGRVRGWVGPLTLYIS